MAANNGSNGDSTSASNAISSRNLASTDSNTMASILSLPNFHVAPPTPAHIHHLRTPTNAPHFFVQDELKKKLLERQTMAMAHVSPDQFPGTFFLFWVHDTE